MPTRRRTVLGRAGRAAAGLALAGSAGLLRGSAPLTKVPASSRPEPPLVHYRLPYGSTPLNPGPALERAYDETALVAALQGIVNRDAPRLYLLGLQGPGEPDLDGFWWQRMAEAGWSVAQATPYEARDLGDLLEIYGRRTRGLVLWDPSVPATQNVAATLAGALDLLPVAGRPAPSLYADLRRSGWRPALSLLGRFTGRGRIPGTQTASSGSAKNDAYRWALAHYLQTGRCSPAHLAYYIDAYWLKSPGAGGAFWNNTLVNGDYYVAERGFFFDLDPWDDEAPVDDPGQRPGTDAATLLAILRAAHDRLGAGGMINAGGFPPWAFKYTDHPGAGGLHAPVPTEWRYAETLSAYDAFMEADALGYAAIANASFTRHLPLKSRYPQPAPPDTAALRRRGFLDPSGSVSPGRYFAFYVGDFDSPAWLYQVGPSLWNDPERGRVPLSWAFNPNLCRRAAPAMVWTRATATPLDGFVAGDSGAGYLNPGALEAPRASGLPSGVAAWRDHCTPLYRQWDLRLTGFIIEGYAPAMQADGLRAYSEFSPGGIVGQKLPSGALVDGMPVLAMSADIGGEAADAAAAVRGLFLPLSEPQFAVARGVLCRPSWYRAVAEAVGAGEAPVQVVDLPTLLALVAADQRSRQAAAPTAAALGQATLVAATGGVTARGLRPVTAADGRWTIGETGGRPAIVFTAPYAPHGYAYLYLTAPWRGAPPQTLWLQVRYFDSPAGLGLLCEYNTATAAYRPTSEVRTGGTGAWKTATWELAGADPRGAQNGGADLRLDGRRGLAVASITLSRTGLP